MLAYIYKINHECNWRVCPPFSLMSVTVDNVGNVSEAVLLIMHGIRYFVFS